MNTTEMNQQPPSGNSKKTAPFNQRSSFWILILLLIVLLIGIHYYRNYMHQHAKPLPFPVVLATAQSEDVPIYLDALGNVTPTYSVTVRTQINGQLMQVLFREGQMVKKNDLLATIDDRPLLAQLMEYTGQYERDKAQLANALIDLKRYQTLWKQDSIAQQTLATQQALVNQLQGTLKLDQGLINTTKVNLIYTKITSPVDGRIGLRLVDPGNFVQTTDTSGIAVINTINPITVIFTLSEDNIPAVQAAMKVNNSLPVIALDRQKNQQLATGQLLTIDNQIDTTTGTVKLRSVFANENNQLFPNQFVNIRLLVQTLHAATVIPTAAIQHDANNNYVYALNQNKAHTVNRIPVVTGVTIGNDTTITSGINPGTQVVTEGADKLTDGASVTTSVTTS